jgi:hypothetical protein
MTARWLLQDNNHVISESPDLMADEDGQRAKRALATAALVKPTSNDPEVSSGRLLLFDPPGRKVMEVANGVRKLHVASYTNGEITLLYERD